MAVWSPASFAQVTTGTATAAKAATMLGDPYYLNQCAVSGNDLTPVAKPIVFDYEGRQLRCGSEANISTFKADPQKYLKEVDAKMIADQKRHYPLNTDVVDGKKLDGSAGQPIDFIYNNRLVRVSSPASEAAFKKDPAKYLKLIDAAVIAKQKPHYPLTTCVVTGQKIGEPGMTPVDMVYANRLVRFCCADCIKEFDKNPAKYLAMVDQAWKAAHMANPDAKHHMKNGEHKPAAGGASALPTKAAGTPKPASTPAK